MNAFDHFLLLLLNLTVSYFLLQRRSLVNFTTHKYIHLIFHFCCQNTIIYRSCRFILQPLLFSGPNIYESLPNILYHRKAVDVYNLLLEILLGHNLYQADFIPSQSPHSLSSSSSSSPSQSQSQSQSQNKNWRPNKKIPPSLSLFPTVVLDLDETLLHVTSEEKKRPVDYFIWDEDHRISSKVYKRPYVDQFLSVLSHYYEIVIFTSSYQCYCDPLINLLTPSSSEEENIIRKRFYNTSLTTTSSSSFSGDVTIKQEKDLYLPAPYNMPHRLLLVDNDSEACSTHPENLYLIPSYLGQEVDYSLIGFLFVLISLVEMRDFRELLSKRSQGFHF